MYSTAFRPCFFTPFHLAKSFLFFLFSFGKNFFKGMKFLDRKGLHLNFNSIETL